MVGALVVGGTVAGLELGNTVVTVGANVVGGPGGRDVAVVGPDLVSVRVSRTTPSTSTNSDTNLVALTRSRTDP